MNRLFLPAVLSLIAFVSGCGSPYALNEVTGKVTLDGNPLDNATIIFNPAGTGASASGVTDASGVYKIRDTRPDADFGAEAGDYEVTVIWSPPPAVDTSKMDSSSADYDKMAAEQARQVNAKPPTNNFPVAYGNPKTSGLKATVKKGKNSDVNFELSSKGPGK